MTKKASFTAIKKITIAIFGVLVVIWLSELKYFRLDLTEDKRYTLSDATKNILENMNDTIRLSVYLSGDLPLSFVNMKREVSDLLNEFKQIADDKILIRFIDPQTIGDGKNIKHTISRLHDSYGLMPYTIQEEDENGKLIQRQIIPGIIVSTSKNYVTVNMLSNTMSNSPEEQIQEALQDLEYQCVKAITQLTAEKRKNIAFLTEQEETPLVYTYNATVSLLDLYNVDRISSQQLLDSLTKYDVLIITEPTKSFSEQDKFIIDQYLMNNGNILFMSDNIAVDIDSLKTSPYTYAMPKDLNISDLLFNWGIRINSTILLDNQCAKIPMNMSNFGEPARFAPVPWYYYPLLKPTKNHLITNNIDVVKAEFASTIDTLEGNGNFTKTVLLTSSAYARILSTPNTVGFNILQSDPNKDFFNKYYIPTSVLVEGQCNSLYQSRKSPLENSTIKIPSTLKRKETSEHNKIIIVSDGDIIRNEIEVTNSDTIPQPLYRYKYFSCDKRKYTGNLNFFINTVSYLCGDVDLLSIRSREVKIRLLNKNRIFEEKIYWQLFNIILPLVIIIATSIIIYFIRKQKYSKKHVS